MPGAAAFLISPTGRTAFGHCQYPLMENSVDKSASMESPAEFPQAIRRGHADLLVVFTQLGKDAEIFQRRGVLSRLAAGCNVTQQSSHDFATASLW